MSTVKDWQVIAEVANHGSNSPLFDRFDQAYKNVTSKANPSLVERQSLKRAGHSPYTKDFFGTEDTGTRTDGTRTGSGVEHIQEVSKKKTYVPDTGEKDLNEALAEHAARMEEDKVFMAQEKAMEDALIRATAKTKAIESMPFRAIEELHSPDQLTFRSDTIKSSIPAENIQRQYSPDQVVAQAEARYKLPSANYSPPEPFGGDLLNKPIAQLLGDASRTEIPVTNYNDAWKYAKELQAYEQSQRRPTNRPRFEYNEPILPQVINALTYQREYAEPGIRPESPISSKTEPIIPVTPEVEPQYYSSLNPVIQSEPSSDPLQSAQVHNFTAKEVEIPTNNRVTLSSTDDANRLTYEMDYFRDGEGGYSLWNRDSNGNLYRDPNGGNCTSWAYARAIDLGADPNSLVKGAHAKDWISRAQSMGVDVGGTPVVGATVAWPSNNGYWGNLGHVGTVENVYPDGSFDMSHSGATIVARRGIRAAVDRIHYDPGTKAFYVEDGRGMHRLLNTSFIYFP